MSTLNWIVIVGVLLVIYLWRVASGRISKKKWNFRVDPFAFCISLILAMYCAYLSDVFANEYVKGWVPHEWREEIQSIQEIEDVSRNLEKEGIFFLGIGGTKELETFRYTVVNGDGERTRKKVSTSDCYILKADKKQRIVRVKYVRMYKNPADKDFFRNFNDVTKDFYKVYLL
jgi:hypothetical protein